MARQGTNRMHRAVMALVALTGAVMVLGMGDALLAQASKKSDSKVKATARAGRPDAQGRQTITLTLNIEKNWHLYANPVGSADLDGVKTVVAVTGKNKPQAVKVQYPRGTIKQDKFFGRYLVYEDQVTIPVQVQRAPGDVGPLQVSIQVNACDKSKCLPPATILLTVP
jgi:DsbC/DsbD-like thiol-disulfide interchange protein